MFSTNLQISCTDTNTISKWTKTRSTWPMSPSSSIRWVQNDSWAFHTFGANHEPFLHQD
jgi:hypothetical protein